MHFQSLAAACLLAFASTSLSEQIPADHILWGPKGPAGATLARRATSTTPATASSTRVADSACSNGPLTRSCWSPGFSIATDFDAKHPTTGRTVTYNWEVTNSTCNPDGQQERPCLLINGQFPGPTVVANWGDYIQVNVKNSMQANGTGIHWHGIRQLSTNTEDGVPGITECPLGPGDTKTYRFQATQFGTSWYHSHLSAQYGDGVLGSIVINGPAAANYDVDLGPFPVMDWYYVTAWQQNARAFQNVQRFTGPGNADTILVNGTNKSPSGAGSYSKVTLTAGKKYRLRLINPSVDNMIRVSLDNHPFTVITSDFVPVKSWTANWLLLGIGQRYDVVFTANQTAGNYWFRAENIAACATGNNFYGRAVFGYAGAPAGDPTSTGYPMPGNCNDEQGLTPWVVNTVPSSDFTNQAKNLDIDLGIEQVTTNGQNIVFWGVNLTAMKVAWDQPTLSYVQAQNTSYPSTYNLLELPVPNMWTFWIIQETGGASTKVPIPHPIHLHGHDFYVLGAGTGVFSPSNDVGKLTFANPTRRDTALLPGGGWLVIAFPTDNPGAWLMHCHISWHISQGLGVQFLETKGSINLPNGDWQKTCQNWNAYLGTKPFWVQDDSGL